MKNIKEVGDALNVCRANPCDPACKECAYRGERGCVEKMHKEALAHLVCVSSQLLALMERGYGKENGAGPKN
jgi:hypothetical protein